MKPSEKCFATRERQNSEWPWILWKWPWAWPITVTCKFFPDFSQIYVNTKQKADICNSFQVIMHAVLNTHTLLPNASRKGKGLDICYSATYMSLTSDQQRFTISEVAADWHEPMVQQRIMWPSIVRANGATENAGLENAGPSKMQGWKTQDWKTRDHHSGGGKRDQ